MARTELFSRKNPGGVFTIVNWRDLPNDGFFLDSTSGTNGTGYGRNPDAPVATLDYAIGLCTASKADKIYIAPWHVENLTTATSVNCDVAGVQIEGVRIGNLMPTFSTTAADGSITVAAANVTLRNIKLVANFATGTTAAITVAAGGDGLTLDNIVFRDTSAANEFLVHVTVATTVDDLTIRNCDLVTAAGSMTNSILFAGTSTNFRLLNNFFFVDSADSVVDHLAGAATSVLVQGNTIINQDTGAAGYVLDFHASSTGAAIDNRGAYNKVDAEMTKGAAMWWVENYFSNTIAESGLLEPSTAHAIP